MLELTPTDVKYIKTSGCQNYNVGDENKLDEEKIRRQSNRNYLKYNRSGWGGRCRTLRMKNEKEHRELWQTSSCPIYMRLESPKKKEGSKNFLKK